jgi:hypothetical protein
MVGSPHSFIISSEHACRTTPASSGSDQLMKSALSQLSRVLPEVPSRRLKVPFQLTLEFTLTSCWNGNVEWVVLLFLGGQLGQEGVVYELKRPPLELAEPDASLVSGAQESVGDSLSVL